MTIRLRTAEPSDLDDVLAFWATAAEDAHRPADSTAALHRLLARDPEALLLAVDDGRLVGTVIAGCDGWRGHVYRLAVDPAARRQGIARQLLARVEQRFADAGAGRSDAMVLEQNDAGRATWTAFGYHRQDEWARWVKPLAH